MIKSTIKRVYTQPSEAPKQAFIQLDAHYTATNVAVILDIKHNAIIDDETGAKQEVFSIRKELNQATYNELSELANAMITPQELEELTPFELVQLKIKNILYLYVTTIDLNEGFTAWGLEPSQWELI